MYSLYSRRLAQNECAVAQSKMLQHYNGEHIQSKLTQILQPHDKHVANMVLLQTTDVARWRNKNLAKKQKTSQPRACELQSGPEYFTGSHRRSR